MFVVSTHNVHPANPSIIQSCVCVCGGGGEGEGGCVRGKGGWMVWRGSLLVMLWREASNGDARGCTRLVVLYPSTVKKRQLHAEATH